MEAGDIITVATEMGAMAAMVGDVCERFPMMTKKICSVCHLKRCLGHPLQTSCSVSLSL
jgi:hypothetical protein